MQICYFHLGYELNKDVFVCEHLFALYRNSVRKINIVDKAAVVSVYIISN